MLATARLRGARCTPSPALTPPFSPPQETTGCLEASAILHIFQVLNDLRCAALREQCTWPPLAARLARHGTALTSPKGWPEDQEK